MKRFARGDAHRGGGTFRLGRGRLTGRPRLKVAATVRGTDIVIRQSPSASASQPLQVLNDEPLVGWALRRRVAPLAKFAAQLAAAQEISAGSLVTVPVPPPVRFTVRMCSDVLKVATTARPPVIGTTQVLF